MIREAACYMDIPSARQVPEVITIQKGIVDNVGDAPEVLGVVKNLPG